MDYILNWIDVLWLPLAYVIVRKGQRIKALLFVMTCILTLRLQVELMQEIGFHKGFLPFLDVPVLYRGYVTYGVIILTFLLLSRYSKERDPYIYMAAGITVFITAFCVSTFIMVL